MMPPFVVFLGESAASPHLRHSFFFDSRQKGDIMPLSSKAKASLVKPAPLANRIAPWDFALCDEEFEMRMQASRENFKKVIKWFSVDNGKPSEWAADGL